MTIQRTGADELGAMGASLRSAARVLEPVVIDTGASHAALESYVVHVDAERMLLSPIAVDAVPAGARARIRPDRPTPEWVLSARELVVCGDGAVEVDLGGARFAEQTRDEARPASEARGLLVLVAAGGLDGRSSYVFGVVRVARDACEIETSEPLSPGTRLPRVELVGDRRVLHRASAEVLAVTPRVTAHGRPTFRCELSLGPLSPEPARAHDLITAAAEVRRLLEFAARVHARGWYEAPGWGRGALRFRQVTRDAAVIELLDGQGAGTPPTSLRVGVELFSVAYELEVRALQRDGDVLHTSLPLILRCRRRHARERLTQVPATEDARVRFVNPLDGSVQTRRVRAISPFGLSFEVELGDAFFWRGMPLERAQLDWRDRLVELGDVEVSGEVDDIEDPRCTVALRDSRLADERTLIELIATAAHPSVSVHRGHFGALLDIYRRAGLFAPHMHRNLAPIDADVTEVWRRLHVDAEDVVRTLTHGNQECPDGAVTVVRVWEHGWVAQHFVDVSPELNGATGKLQRAYLDHLLPRPDGRYLVFFVKSDNHVMMAYMRRFFAGVGTPEAATQCPVELWSAPADAGSRAVATAARPLRPDERLLAERAAERCLGRDAAQALSLTADTLELPDTRARFARAALDRSRECRVLEHEGDPTHVLVEERATPGINLTWMLNATWILPVQPGARAGLERALSDVLARPAQAPTGERFLNVPVGLEEDILIGAGFERIARVEMFVLNRAGVHQFFQYASRRYGELDALASRRRARGGASSASRD